MATDMSQEGMVVKTDSTSTMKYMKRDGKMLSRTETKSSMMYKMGEMEQKTDSQSLIVVDGEHMWSLTDTQGQKNATKTKVSEAQQQTDPTVGWEHFNVKLLPEEKVDGKACWAIEMTPKQGEAHAMNNRTVSYYDKETGLPLKTIGFDDKGKEVTTITISDIKINEKIDPKLFKFEAPAGVEVHDATSMKTGAMP